MSDALQAVLAEGVADGTFGTARAVVLHRGRTVFDGGPASLETWFDLASVTKVLGTTHAFLALAATGAVREDTRLRSLLPTAAADVTLGDLLFHRSGLPAFLPYFAQVLTPDRAKTVALALATAPTAPVGTAAIYSDIGFILLGEALSAAAAQPLDGLVHGLLGRLGIGARYRRLSAAPPLPPELAPTNGTRPREPAPGQEGLWSTPTQPGRPGEVDDDNAWVMDGVSGHAGLFGTARDVATFGQAVLDGRLAPPRPWAKDASTPGSTRALGFDTPSDEGASAGPRFGRAGPKGAIGHLGFTGTSVWIDLDRQLVVALLTNRVWRGRANVAIRAFRPRFHEAVLSQLAL